MEAIQEAEALAADPGAMAYLRQGAAASLASLEGQALGTHSQASPEAA